MIHFKQIQSLFSPVGNIDKTFLKLDNGQSVVGCFRGELMHFHSRWEDGRSQTCDKDAENAQFRFRVNFVFKERGFIHDNQGFFASRIFENGIVAYEQICELVDEFDLENTWVRIKRVGNDKFTRYEIEPIRKFEITEEQQMLLKSVDLKKLGVGFAVEAG